MPQIRKILFPVDFAYTCYGTARWVESFARRFDAEILLLHAVECQHATSTKEHLASAKARLESFLSSDLRWFKTDRLCVAEEPYTAIAHAAESWQPDLITIPTHGMGAFRSRMVGSVTAKVLHDLSCPVWTSLHAEAAPQTDSIQIRKILCAVDFSKRSTSMLQWAAWFAGQYGAELGIVHAVGRLNVPGTWAEREDRHIQIEAQARTRIEEVTNGAYVPPASLFVIAEPPAVAVSRAASEFGADLLVIGRHEEDGSPQDNFQNACSIIESAPCPVISI